MPLSDEEIDKRYEIAYALYESDKAEEGMAYSQFYIGWMYYSGSGVEENFDLAEEYFLKASLQNNERAMFYLGLVFIEIKEFKMAVEWFEKSASFNFPPALYRMGLYCDRGRHMKTDKSLAFKSFELAGKLGHVPAMIQVSLMLLKGHSGILGRIKDVYKLLNAFCLACNLGMDGKDSERFLE